MNRIDITNYFNKKETAFNAEKPLKRYKIMFEKSGASATIETVYDKSEANRLKEYYQKANPDKKITIVED